MLPTYREPKPNALPKKLGFSILEASLSHSKTKTQSQYLQ